MDKNFLETLKKSLDDGEFNSEIADKFGKITELAEEKLKGGNISKLQEDHKKRLDDAGIRKGDPEEIEKINKEYEKEMEKIKREDHINKWYLDILLQYENIVKAKDNLYEEIEGIEKYIGPEDSQATLTYIKEIKEKLLNV